MFRTLRLLLLLALSFAPLSAQAAGKNINLGGVDAVYWAPAVSAAKPPFIFFSHGFRGCATQSAFLMEALAADGYWVFAPNHKDAGCHHLFSAEETRQSLAKLMRPDLWDDTTYADRRDDIEALFDALQHDARFKDKIDFTRLGLVGHSLGGYTVLGLGGAWSSWKMPGVKAVLALSPYSQPFNLQHTIAGVSVPVMFQGGTKDFGITPFVSRASGSYDQALAPKYFVDFEGASHLAWTELIKGHQAAIVDYSEAFLDHYLKGDPASPDLTAATPDVAELRYNSELGSNDPKP